MSFLAVRYTWAYRNQFSTPDWLKEADLSFVYVVGPERSENQNIVRHQTTYNGIRLHYQPIPADTYEGHTCKSWADNKVVDPKALTAFERSSLTSGHVIVNGLSGSANILLYLYSHIQKSNDRFDPDEAFLLAATFLAFDGGHSFQESMAVRLLLQNPYFPPPPQTDRKELSLIKRAQIAEFSLKYSDIANLSSDVEVQKFIRSALSEALDTITETT
jgi:hypothetical protein